MMNSKPHRLLSLLIATITLAALGGCSAESKKSGHLSKGAQFLASGDYEKAELEYKNALQIERGNAEAITRLGIIYFDQGRFGPSVMFLREANRLQPQNSEVRLRLVKLLLSVQDSTEARAILAPLLDATPPHEEAPGLLAESATTPKDIKEAREKLLKLPNQTAGVLTGLAVLELRDNKTAEAEALLARALALNPKLAITHTAIGLIHQSKKDLAKAEQSFLAAVAGEPARSPRRIQLAQFYLRTDQLPAAKRTLDELVKQAPDLIPARILVADIAAREKRYADSLAMLDRVFALDPSHPEALLLAGQVRQANGELDKAISILESAVKTYPKSALVQHQLGLAYLARGESSKAAAGFAEAVALSPNFVPSIIALAETNVRQRNFVSAIASLKVLLQKAEIAEARFLLGNAYRLQGNLEEALATYRQLSAALPNNAQLRFFTGLVLLQQNQRTAAREELTKASTLAPNDLAAVELLVQLDLAEKQPATARKRVEEQIAKNATATAPRLLLANIQLTQSDAAGAEATLRKAIDLQPESLDAYILLARILVSRNEQAKALADLQVAAAKNPKDPRPVFMTAVLQEGLKNYPAARDSYEKVLAINPKSDVALNNLAYLYSEQIVDLDKALALAERAREAVQKINPANLLPSQSESTADTLGWILYKKKQYARALTLLEESGAKLTDNAEAQAHFGLACYATGDEARARSVLTGALKVSSQFPGVEQAKKALSVLNLDPVKGGADAKAELEKIVAAQPDDTIALVKLAQIHERAGDSAKALAMYQAALKGSTGNVVAGLSIVRLQRAKNDLSGALETANALRKAAPSDGRVAAALGQLTYQSGEYPRAYNLLQEAARRLPDDADVLYDYGVAAYSVGRVADAESSIRDALQKAPNFARTTEAKRFLEISAIAANPATSGAAATVDSALKADPNHAAALFARASLANAAHNTEAARQDCEKVLARYPDFTPVKRQLAILYAEKAVDDKKALELGTKARETYPNDAELSRALGVLSFRTGNFPRAVSLLQESARTRTTDADLMFTLGMAQRQTKDIAGSAKSLQKALDLGLKGDAAKEARTLLTPEKPAK